MLLLHAFAPHRSMRCGAFFRLRFRCRAPAAHQFRSDLRTARVVTSRRSLVLAARRATSARHDARSPLPPTLRQSTAHPSRQIPGFGGISGSWRHTDSSRASRGPLSAEKALLSERRIPLHSGQVFVLSSRMCSLSSSRARRVQSHAQRIDDAQHGTWDGMTSPSQPHPTWDEHGTGNYLLPLVPGGIIFLLSARSSW